MIKKVTKKWLKEKDACEPSLDYVCANGYIGLPPVEFIRELMSEGRFPDANWLIVRIMDKRQRVKYAVFAAEQVLHIYEKKYPDNKNLRKAIEAAKKYVENPCEETETAAAYAACAGSTNAACAASYAAATVACDDPAVTATSAAYSAVYAYTVANGYSVSAEKNLQVKIIGNGIKILIEEN